jgi:hypothetical protein
VVTKRGRIKGILSYQETSHVDATTCVAREAVEQLDTQVKKECGHYWRIGSADGPTSKGICKLCGLEKEFNNSFLDFSHSREDKSVFSLPKLDAVEPEVEN